MKKLLLTLLLITSSHCFSQINFEKGYFITNSDERVECLIKNLDWKNTPDSFKYKMNENTEIITVSLNNVKEFQIENQSKYIRKKLKVDLSSNNINDINLGYNKNAVFKEETIFLKLIVDGNIQLFSYSDNATIKYFYGQNYENIEQLIYKVYLSSSNQNAVSENRLYISQLENLFDCASFNEKQIKRTEYSDNSLSSLFIKYNSCIDPQFSNQNTNKKIKRDFFNLSFRPRINSSALELKNSSGNYKIDMDNEVTFGAGLEAEFILPYNKNKWTLIIEPTYQYYKSQKSSPHSNIVGGILTADANYKSLQLPIGVRHYFFVTDKSKIFVNASYVLAFDMSSSIIITRNDNSVFDKYTDSKGSNLTFGAGYKYDKFSIEFKFFASKDILDGIGRWEGNYKNLSLVFGYTIF